MVIDFVQCNLINTRRSYFFSSVCSRCILRSYCYRILRCIQFQTKIQLLNNISLCKKCLNVGGLTYSQFIAHNGNIDCTCNFKCTIQILIQGLMNITLLNKTIQDHLHGGQFNFKMSASHIFQLEVDDRAKCMKGYCSHLIYC